MLFVDVLAKLGVPHFMLCLDLGVVLRFPFAGTDPVESLCGCGQLRSHQNHFEYVNYAIH